MQLRQFNNVEEFWQYANTYLLQHEAEHNLLLGILHNLQSDRSGSSDAPYFLGVEDNGEIVAIAMQTSGNNLLLSKAKDRSAITLIAQEVQHRNPLPGISALVDEGLAFLKAWETLSDRAYQCRMKMRIYQLKQVNAIAASNGSLILATESDRDLLIDWYTGFAEEVGNLIVQPPESLAEAALKRQSIYLWFDQEPVTMVGGVQFIPTAARIYPVYTPPASRRKGYAQTAVAALCQQFLDRGCQSCYLFADLANPTANHVYNSVGFNAVCDWHDYIFVPKELE